MSYAEMDKRKLLLPDLLGKPIGVTTENGQMVFPKDTELPKDHYIFFYSVKEWIEINEILGRNK